jgi:hypothetical protein
LLLFRLSPAGLQRTLHSHFMLPRAIVPDPTTLVSLPVKSDQPNSPRIPAFLARSLSSSRNTTVAAFDRAQTLSPHVRRSMPTVQSPSLLDLSSKLPCNQLHHAQLYRYASASRPHPICRCPPTSPRRASRPRRFHRRVTSSWCLGSSWPPMSRGAWGGGDIGGGAWCSVAHRAASASILKSGLGAASFERHCGGPADAATSPVESRCGSSS